MDSGTVLAVLVGIIALAMVGQAVAVLMLVLSFRKYCDRIEAVVMQVSRDMQPVLQSAREILSEGKETIASISVKVNAISDDLVEITGKIKGQVTRIDGLLTEASDRARVQLVRLDDLVANTVGQVEETTQVIRRAILTPVRELSAVLAGVRSGLDFLFRRRKGAVDHATQDEELFI